jgi:hypothetical protein
VARQVITLAEVRTQKGRVHSKAEVRPDVKYLIAVGPDGKTASFTEDFAGRWHATYRIPAAAHGPVEIRVRAVDVADNASEQVAKVEVEDARMGSR